MDKLDTLIKVYDSTGFIISIREFMLERGEIAGEMKKVAKKSKGKAARLVAENIIDYITYDIKKKEFTFNAI
nr:MAG TPA: hypothetical protein [Caudoviricetes sp.]